MPPPVHPAILSTPQYLQAKAACIQQVQEIVTERTVNGVITQWRDPDFDIAGNDDARKKCLYGIRPEYSYDSGLSDTPKRISDLFKNPVFVIDYGKPQPPVQGKLLGDCWFLSAVTSVARNNEFSDAGESWLQKICVAKNEAVGVYGFLIFRDGHWAPVVVDDWLFTNDENPALPHFARSSDSRETWVSLLEKAFAKLHGDYSSIDDGLTHEGLQDLTGAVATLIPKNFHDGDDGDPGLWQKLLRVTEVGDRLFGVFRPFPDVEAVEEEKAGVVTKKLLHKVQHGHAYTVLRTVEYQGEKFVLLRNPYGRKDMGVERDFDPNWEKIGTGQEWDDFRARWKKFDKNDGHNRNGVFLMQCKFLHQFSHSLCSLTALLLDNQFRVHWESFFEARLFGPEWDLATLWLRVQGANLPEDITVFSFAINGASPAAVVISLAQLDNRYYQWAELLPNVWHTLRFKLIRVDNDQVLHDSETRGTNLQGRDRIIWQESDGLLSPGNYTVLLKNPGLIHKDRFGSLEKSDTQWQYSLHDDDKLFMPGEANWTSHKETKYQQLLVNQRNNRSIAANINNSDGTNAHDASNSLADTKRTDVGITQQFVHEYYRLQQVKNAKTKEAAEAAKAAEEANEVDKGVKSDAKLTAEAAKEKAVNEFTSSQAKLDEYRDAIREAAAVYVGLRVYSKRAEGTVTLEPGPDVPKPPSSSESKV
ncbi:hypothetical protein HWV62_37366 [Athelia sp. TMB]|nr:hypothetical protein HWV62_37366 [Athelia sp. TMB]